MTTDTVHTINLEPEWEATCQYFAEVFVQHGFEKWAYTPMVSLMEQVRYLTQTDPEALARIMARLTAKDHRAAPSR